MSRFSIQLSRINDASGLDIDTTTAGSLLAEGARELCLRSEWLQASLELGPTVAGQTAYATPANVERFLTIALAGVPLHHLSEEQVRWANDNVTGFLFEHGSGGYYETVSATGTESVSIYPSPAVSGSSITGFALIAPPDFSDSVDPKTPVRFDRYIGDYVLWQGFERYEDDPELGAAPQQRFENGVIEARQLRAKRYGRDVLEPLVVGYQV